MVEQQTPPEKMIKRVTLRLEPELYEKLKAQAKRERRSLHAQVVWLLDQATTK